MVETFDFEWLVGFPWCEVVEVMIGRCLPTPEGPEPVSYEMQAR